MIITDIREGQPIYSRLLLVCGFFVVILLLEKSKQQMSNKNGNIKRTYKITTAQDALGSNLAVSRHLYQREEVV